MHIARYLGILGPMKKVMVVFLVAAIVIGVVFLIFSSKSYVLYGFPQNPLSIAQNGGASAKPSLSVTSSSSRAAPVGRKSIFSPVTGVVDFGASILAGVEAKVNATAASGAVAAKTKFADAFNGGVDALRSVFGVPDEAAQDTTKSTPISVAGISGGVGSEPVAGSAIASGTVIAPLVGSVISQHGTIRFVVNGDLFRAYHATEALLAIDWDDGSQASKQLSASAGNIFLSHVYDTTGTYRPIFAFTIASTSVSYEFTVVVL